jgi:hypothetical protein
VVRQVIDGILQYHVPRLLGDDVAGNEQAPR